jgi:hypothetical protein
VAGIAHRLGRHLAGAAAVAVALSILASAASAGAGGSFGDLIGGTASRVLTPFAGVPLALTVLAGVIWAVLAAGSGNNEGPSERRKGSTTSGCADGLGGPDPR